VRVDEHTIDLAGAPVFYRRAGAPEVPVLYLHGLPTSSDDWIPFLERTGGLAPDLIGFGRSSKGGHLDYSIQGHADFLERFLAALGVTRVGVVAHDWGAGGGLVLAQRQPELIERLVLIDPLPLLEGFHWGRTARLLRRPLLGELLMGATTRWVLARTLRSAAVSPGAWSQDRLRSVWEQFDQGTQRAVLRLHRAADERRLAQAGAGLSALDVPALVMWGERDPWFEPRFADAYGAVLPRSTVQRVPDAGHWPWLDRPELIDRVVEFLE
jgi:pimeloyl-ACP methyl ester carboxylesterase